MFEVLKKSTIFHSIEIKSVYKKLARQYHPDMWNIHKRFSKKKCEEFQINVIFLELAYR